MLPSLWSKAGGAGPQQLLGGQLRATPGQTQPSEPSKKQLCRVTGHVLAEQADTGVPMPAPPARPWPGQGGRQDHSRVPLRAERSQASSNPAQKLFFFFLFQHSSAWLQFSEEQIGTFIGHSFLLQPAAA